MANFHYGRIGSMWKHLVLAEVLSIESPSAYWESHAGSSHYPLVHSIERDYGIFYFAEHAEKLEIFSNAAYTQLLKNYKLNGLLTLCPGSPLIAMTLLNAHKASFLFCDTDTHSLSTIINDAHLLNIPEYSAQIVEQDGITTLNRAIADLSYEAAKKTFAHIDPYEMFLSGDDGSTSVDLFCHISMLGGKAMLWYGFDSKQYREYIHLRLQHFFHIHSFNPSAYQLWCGEITLDAINNPHYSFNPGTMGCGIILSNLSIPSHIACKRLGETFEKLYAPAMLPQQQSGAVTFRECHKIND